MIDVLKKTVLSGIGLAAMTKDKVEDLCKDCVAKGQLTEQEGEKFVSELLQRSEEAKAELEQQVNKATRKVIEKMHLVRVEDVQALETEIALLRTELAELKTGQQETPEDEGN